MPFLKFFNCYEILHLEVVRGSDWEILDNKDFLELTIDTRKVKLA